MLFARRIACLQLRKRMTQAEDQFMASWLPSFASGKLTSFAEFFALPVRLSLLTSAPTIWGYRSRNPPLKITSARVTTRKTMLIKALRRKKATLIQLRLRRRAIQCSKARQSAMITQPTV